MSELIVREGLVKPDWIDSYGHMNMAYYVLACDHSTYAFWESANGDARPEERGGAEYAVVETHVNYREELRLDDPFRVSTQLLGADEKRFRLFHTLTHASEGFLAATNEVMALGFDLNARGLMRFKPAVQARMQEILAEHSRLPLPDNAGRFIAMPGTAKR